MTNKFGAFKPLKNPVGGPWALAKYSSEGSSNGQPFLLNYNIDTSMWVSCAAWREAELCRVMKEALPRLYKVNGHESLHCPFTLQGLELLKHEIGSEVYGRLALAWGLPAHPDDPRRRMQGKAPCHCKPCAHLSALQAHADKFAFVPSSGAFAAAATGAVLHFFMLLAGLGG